MAEVAKKSRKKVSAQDILSGSTKKVKVAKSSKSLEEKENREEASFRNFPKGSEEPKWYVLNIQTGHENSAGKAIKQRVEATGIKELVEDVLVPVQKKIIVKNGKQKIVEERIFPGYVLIKMVLSEKTWEIVTSTEGVTGFVKTDKYPRPLPENEVQAIMKFMEIEQPAYQSSFSLGEAVKIADGAFTDFIGSIKEIDETKGKVKVLISFLGREAPVELDFSQIRKL